MRAATVVASNAHEKRRYFRLVVSVQTQKNVCTSDKTSRQALCCSSLRKNMPWRYVFSVHKAAN